MKCSGCGKSINEPMQKCPYCGTPIRQFTGNNSSMFGGSTFAGHSALSGFSDRTTKSKVAQMSDNGNDVYENNIRAIGEITNISLGCAGSGFVISEDGYVLTNSHVSGEVRSADIMVHICNQNIRAELITATSISKGVDLDLALLKLQHMPQGCSFVKFCKTSDVKIGEEIYCIGNSQGLGTRITKGIVSAVRNGSHDIGKDIVTILTDCSINHGNSGGPMFDSKGYVIGVNTWGMAGEDMQGGIMNYAICTDEVEKFIAEANKKSRLNIHLAY